MCNYLKEDVRKEHGSIKQRPTPNRQRNVEAKEREILTDTIAWSLYSGTFELFLIMLVGR